MSAPEMDFVVVEKGHSTFKIIDDDLNVAFAGGQQTILRAGPKLPSRIERFGITRDDLGPANVEIEPTLYVNITSLNLLYYAVAYQPYFFLKQQPSHINVKPRGG